MFRICALGLICLFSTFEIGCATPGQLRRFNEGPAHAPAQAAIHDVPFVEQADNHCGPAALAMALQKWGGNESMKSLSPLSYTPSREGTLAADLSGAARRRGFLVTQIENLRSLLQEITAGHPVIVMQNLGLSWLPRWHFAVAIGYNLDTQQITLHSGKERALTMDLALFVRTWERAEHWAVTALPPTRIAVSATERSALESAAALERLGLHENARLAYKTISARWPKSAGALFGLANAHAALGNHDAAIQELERAKALQPRSSTIDYNLSLVRQKLLSDKRKTPKENSP